MRPWIPFIAAHGFAQLDTWVQLVRKAMPEADGVDFREIEQSRCADVSLAIVTNPDPTDLRRFAKPKFEIDDDGRPRSGGLNRSRGSRSGCVGVCSMQESCHR